jgi:hypothetical protein
LSLDAGAQAGIVAAGGAAVLVLAGAIFRAVNLRGDSNKKWSSRIDLAVVALDEKTVVELRELRTEIDELLPSDEGLPFDPIRVSADPGPLSQRVKRTAAFYAARMRMQKDLDRVLRLGRSTASGCRENALDATPVIGVGSREHRVNDSEVPMAEQQASKSGRLRRWRERWRAGRDRARARDIERGSRQKRESDFQQRNPSGPRVPGGGGPGGG